MIENLNDFFRYFFFIFFEDLTCKEFCRIDNILHYKKLKCSDGQLMFGFFNFNSEESQFEYEYDSSLDIKIIKKYKSQIMYFLEKNCDKKKRIRIKEITNLETFNYKTQIIISCIFKNE